MECKILCFKLLNNPKGKEELADNYIYEGDFFEGKKQGKGKFHWSDGSSYEGDFFDDRLEGKGFFFF